MVVGVARIDVRLFDVHSLKQKRSQVKRLLHRLRTSFPLSAAEVGCQNQHQRALLGVSICTENDSIARSVFRTMEADLERYGVVEIVNIDFDYLHYGEDVH